MKLKVCHIASGDVWGGAEAQVSNLVAGLAEFHCLPSVLLFADGLLAKKLAEREVLYRLVSEETSTLNFFRSALRSLRELQPDIVVAHGYKEVLVASLYFSVSSCPFIDVRHGATESHVGFQKWKQRFYQGLRRLCSRFMAARLVCVSKTLAHQLEVAHWKHLEVIYNSALALPVETSANNAIAGQDDDLSLVIVGRLNAVKRVDLAIEAFSLFTQSTQRKSSLYVIGEGPLENDLKLQASKSTCKDSVFFLGFRDDAASIIHSADVLLISSDSEGLPTVMLEAMQSAVPIVSTSVGGIPELAEMFPSYPMELCSPGDAAALAASLSRIAERISNGLFSDERAFLENFNLLFSQRANAENHLKLYETIVKQRI